LLGYRLTQAMKVLLAGYGKSRLEEACAYAVQNHVTGTPELRNILSKNIDRLLGEELPEAVAEIAHENIRGADYYYDLLKANEEDES
jgi:hypothetical protein